MRKGKVYKDTSTTTTMIKNKLPIQPITYEQFYKDLNPEIERLVKWIKKTESPSDACKDFIFHLVTELGESHYTTLGILTEVLHEWRNTSDEVLSEEEDGTN